MRSGVIIPLGLKRDRRIDLPEILEVLGARVLGSQWSCSDLNYVSRDDRGVAVLETAAIPGGSVTGSDLVNGLGQLLQVVDGVFTATDAEGQQWVIVRAVDSSWWEVQSTDDSMVEAVRESFSGTEPTPGTAG